MLTKSGNGDVDWYLIHPITDEDVKFMVSVKFKIFIRAFAVVLIDPGLNENGKQACFEEFSSLKNYIKYNMTPEQRELITDYICQNLEKIRRKYFREIPTKRTLAEGQA